MNSANKSIKKDNLYIITGGAGFLGYPLVQNILNLGGRVRVISRDEGNLVKLKESFNEIEIFPGDISDKFEIKQALNGANGIFHLAASKHVGLAEKFVRENIKTNVIGSMNIYEESVKLNNLEFVISISTDKAAQVNGVYGATKLLMERLSIQYENLNPNCKYRIVRYGNVLYSTGSVLTKWKKLIENGEPVTVTSMEATRFFWKVDEAIGLIFDCLINAKSSKPYCPEMKSIKVSDLLEAMIIKYSNGKKIKKNIIGLQEGENLHEKVQDNGPFSNEVESYTINEILELI